MLPGGININIGNGAQGVYGQPGSCGPQGNPMGAMMRTMQMMLYTMSRMMGMGGQQGCGCCPHHNPNFGGRSPFQPQFGGGLQIGASISAFLG